MAGSYSNFEEVIGRRLQQFSPEAIRQRHIALAKRGLAQFLATHANARPKLYVDGHSAASEAEIRPFGTIVYEVRRGQLAAAARFAKQVAAMISPVVSGRYQRAWQIVLPDGSPVGDEEIPPAALELTLVNGVLYARKIELFGARLVGVPPGIVERVREHILQRFGEDIDAQVVYIRLPGGYVLKSTGEEMAYPALVMRLRN